MKHRFHEITRYEWIAWALFIVVVTAVHEWPQ